jgi:hypothetical protein
LSDLPLFAGARGIARIPLSPHWNSHAQPKVIREHLPMLDNFSLSFDYYSLQAQPSIPNRLSILEWDLHSGTGRRRTARKSHSGLSAPFRDGAQN